MPPSVIELSAFPVCDSNVSDAEPLRSESSAFVSYDICEPEDSVALLRVEHCARLIDKGPNDESFHKHPCYSIGLRHYTIQEVIDSPWLADVAKTLDRDRHISHPKHLRHSVLALKETTVDIAARDIALLGVFPSHAFAMQAALTYTSS